MTTDTLRQTQIERLGILVEELGEAAQAAGRVLRFHYDNVDPTLTPLGGYGVQNDRENLEDELGDVLHAILLLAVNDDVELDRVARRAGWKGERVRSWLQHPHRETVTRDAARGLARLIAQEIGRWI